MSSAVAVKPIPGTRAAPSAPLRMFACLILSDALGLIVSVVVGVLGKFAFDDQISLTAYLQLWPFLFVFLSVYAAIGLYTGVALSPPEELRRTTLASTLVFVILAAVTVTFRGGSASFTWTLLLSIALSIAVVPIFRAITRAWLGNALWWGFPAVIFGVSDASEQAVRTLQRDPGLGLRPAVVLDDWVGRRQLNGVPVIRGIELGDYLDGLRSSAYAVVVLSGESTSGVRALVERHGRHFDHVLVVPDLLGFSSYSVNEKMVGGRWGLEICQRAVLLDYLKLKRAIDLFLCLCFAPLALPLVAVIATLVKLDSPGSVFFGHNRIGRHGRVFRAWKFRSMVVDGDRVLADYLSDNPRAREEWNRTHKLNLDPRVTAVGRILRKTSMDELPQLWNIFRGEMSHVGPRPIVDAEVVKYGASFELYKSVDSGLTGLWQVSGRNDLSYEERVILDSFYARNWSIWLDMCILFRTIGAVLFRKGAC